MIKIGIIGATGYTGVELLRLLAAHPQAEVIDITSRQETGREVVDIFPNLRGHYDLKFLSPDEVNFSACDVVFSATPNGVAMRHAQSILDQGIKFIDLSADFRLQDIDIWEQWYGMDHQAKALVDSAVYGLPEMNRENIINADLIACPGCYPTASQLALYPLLKHNLIKPEIIIDAKSGVSGAGRKESIDNLLAESADSIKAYAVNGHRHLPEILQGLNAIADQNLSLTFVPHLMPIIRGILVTAYADLTDSTVDLHLLYNEFYSDEPFVDVLPTDVSPQTRSVRGSNICRINVFKPQDANKVVVLAAEDNLVKGAAGQAIQCMNLCCGINEVAGLDSVPLLP